MTYFNRSIIGKGWQLYIYALIGGSSSCWNNWNVPPAFRSDSYMSPSYKVAPCERFFYRAILCLSYSAMSMKLYPNLGNAFNWQMHNYKDIIIYIDTSWNSKKSDTIISSVFCEWSRWAVERAVMLKKTRILRGSFKTFIHHPLPPSHAVINV